jgi:tetratricopeptide (TPR) repeat protein
MREWLRRFRWAALVCIALAFVVAVATSRAALAQTPKPSAPPKAGGSTGRPAKPPPPKGTADPKTRSAPPTQRPRDEPAAPVATKAEIHKQQGFVYYRLGRYAEARTAFEQALALDQGDLALYLALGQTALKTDAPRTAVDYLTRALGLPKLSQGQQAEVLEQLGLVYMELGEPQPAVETLRKALAAGRDTCPVRQSLGFALVKLEQWEPAVTELQAALERC